MNRRKFCKSVSCGAFGILSLPLLAEKAFRNNSACLFGPGTRLKQEGTVAQKITAVNVRVISQKGTCALGHKVGDKIKFKESGVQGKICIHALYSMLPAVFAMMFDAQFPWLADPDTKTHACPDAKNPVVFEITRVRE